MIVGNVLATAFGPQGRRRPALCRMVDHPHLMRLAITSAVFFAALIAGIPSGIISARS